MKKNDMPPEKVLDYMIEHGLAGKEGRKEIANRTASSVRSVERWLQYGIPKVKWVMLQMWK